MEAMKGKKGFFFTFLSIIAMSLFIVIFTPQSEVSYKKNSEAIKTRIFVIDNYVLELESNYLEVALRAASYKTILSLVYYVNQTRAPISNLDKSFYEVVRTGNISNPLPVPIDSITGKKIMKSNYLMNFTDKIAETSEDALNVNTSIRINNASITQVSPWELKSILDVNITVQSNEGEWKRNNVIVTTSFSIEEVPDPYYLLNLNGGYSNKVKRSSMEFDEWNLTYVREHLRNGTYVHWKDSQAPSFLMRLSGDMSNSTCCGIESLVNPNRLTVPDVQESYVDYQFWTSTVDDCKEIYNITNPNSPATEKGLWDEFPFFKLDLDHTALYNITSEYAVRNC